MANNYLKYNFFHLYIKVKNLVSYSTSDFRPGLKVIIENSPCDIIEEEFVKPGKGQAFSKIKFRNLLTGRIGEKTCKVGESLEAADVVETEMQYLYSDGDQWHFMNLDTYDQLAVDKKVMGNNQDWLKEEDICKVLLWNEIPISLKLPNFVELEITETEPGVKGDTVSGGNKNATLSTGIVIKVPLFLLKGDIVIIDTRTGEYQGRK